MKGRAQAGLRFTADMEMKIMAPLRFELKIRKVPKKMCTDTVYTRDLKVQVMQAILLMDKS